MGIFDWIDQSFLSECLKVSDYTRAPQELVFPGALPPSEIILDPEGQLSKVS